ncbi:MAG TPA: helix-turn-helix domain-containing protein [Patescibacteria group bacterium]|nr:helix-turn-helix domain-containing protein [Patescibacteria group bacterium]
MEIKQLLQNFGLNQKEIDVYLALIQLGPSPVRLLAQKSGVNRGTTYDILKSLIAQGLVSYFDKASHQYFAAESPEKLLTAVENKRSELEEVKQSIQDYLPELKVIFEKRGGKPVMKLFEGIKGIKMILDDVLTTMSASNEKTYYVFSSATVRKNVYEAMPNFSQLRIKKGIKVKTISLGEGGQLVGLDERKWIDPENKNLKSTYELIYGGKVAHISLDEGNNPVGVVIQNEAIFDTQKMIFEFSWNQL